MTTEEPAGPVTGLAAATPSPLALQRHLDYLLREAGRFPCGELRHFLGCALLALEDYMVGRSPSARLRAGKDIGHA